jgi:hypothetical protein
VPLAATPPRGSAPLQVQEPVCAPGYHPTQGFCSSPGTGVSLRPWLLPHPGVLLLSRYRSQSVPLAATPPRGFAPPQVQEPVCAPGCQPTQGFCSSPGTGSSLCPWLPPHPGVLLLSRYKSHSAPLAANPHRGSAPLQVQEPVCAPGYHPNQGFCSSPDTGASLRPWVPPLPGVLLLSRYRSQSAPLATTPPRGSAPPQVQEPVCAPGCYPTQGFCSSPGTVASLRPWLPPHPGVLLLPR